MYTFYLIKKFLKLHFYIHHFCLYFVVHFAQKVDFGSKKVPQKWTLGFHIPRFRVLVLKYSSYNAVFLQHGFFQAPKTALKEECLYDELDF